MQDKSQLQCDPEEYQRMLRVDLDTFNYILDGIHDVIEPQKINYRRVIHADERLSVTLYYLATGRYFFKKNWHNVNEITFVVSRHRPHVMLVLHQKFSLYII